MLFIFGLKLEKVDPPLPDKKDAPFVERLLRSYFGTVTVIVVPTPG